ncbi:MAG: sulfite exporter TauE/SafE family protein [Candidatus Woesearchaeota archaeon]
MNRIRNVVTNKTNNTAQNINESRESINNYSTNKESTESIEINQKKSIEVERKTEKLEHANLFVDGMQCKSCEEKLRNAALTVYGVKDAKFDYGSRKGVVTFDPKKTKKEKIRIRIEKEGYLCKEVYIEKDREKSGGIRKSLGLIFLLLGIAIAGFFIYNITQRYGIEISEGMSYWLLFSLGLITGFHCIAMCGGFVVGYTGYISRGQKNEQSMYPHMIYGASKTASYTIIGAIFGLFGSIVAFTPLLRGLIGVIAGLFLVFFGLRMLNVIPALQRVSFKTPGFVSKLIGQNSSSNKTNTSIVISPMITGLLNGLMIACGPLLAIYIMAAGTGSMLEGAKMLFVFGLGTLPVMLGFAYFTSLLTQKFTTKIIKVSGVIVILLGVIMLNRGLALTGTGFDLKSISTSFAVSLNKEEGTSLNQPPVNIDKGYQEIRMEVYADGWHPDTFVLEKGVPVRWIINGKQINGCNNAIVVPKLGLEFDIKQGEQVIEFTPTEEGIIPWSCWMGMIDGTFIVKENSSSEETLQGQGLKNLQDNLPIGLNNTLSLESNTYESDNYEQRYSTQVNLTSQSNRKRGWCGCMHKERLFDDGQKKE